MERLDLKASPRQMTGKGPNRRLRMAGQVPAVLYGPGVEGALSLSLRGADINKVLHTSAGANVLVNLHVEGAPKPSTAMFKSISRDPVREGVIHVDLLNVLMDHKIMVQVPVHLLGKAQGVALGGIVQHEMRRLRVECLPAGIPDSIDVDISGLNIGNSLHISDISFPEGVRAVDDAGSTVVSIVAPAAEETVKTADEIKAELAGSFEEKEKEKEKGAAE